MAVASIAVDRVAVDRSVALIEPQVEVLPDPIGPDDPQDRAWQHKKWISFPGSWGMRLLLGLAYGGPTGPSHKGLKWHNPFVWVERTCTPDFLVY